MLIPHVGKVPFWKVATDAFNLKANYAGLVSWPGTAPGFDNLRMKLNKISFSRIPDAKKLPEHSKIKTIHAECRHRQHNTLHTGSH